MPVKLPQVLTEMLSIDRSCLMMPCLNGPMSCHRTIGQEKVVVKSSCSSILLKLSTLEKFGYQAGKACKCALQNISCLLPSYEPMTALSLSSAACLFCACVMTRCVLHLSFQPSSFGASLKSHQSQTRLPVHDSMNCLCCSYNGDVLSNTEHTQNNVLLLMYGSLPNTSTCR